MKLYGYEGEKWICYFWYNRTAISLGISICWKNIEIHLPGGFLRIGQHNHDTSLMRVGWHWGEYKPYRRG
jgi:hypothetical protein